MPLESSEYCALLRTSWAVWLAREEPAVRAAMLRQFDDLLELQQAISEVAILRPNPDELQRPIDFGKARAWIARERPLILRMADR